MPISIEKIKGWSIYPIGALIVYTVVQLIIERSVGPVVDSFFNATAIGAESLGRIDISWVAPIFTVLIIGLIFSWHLNRITNELHEWQDDCSMLFKDRNELKAEIQYYQEKLQRIYEKDPSLNTTHETSYGMDVILRQATPKDTQLVNIMNKLSKIRK